MFPICLAALFPISSQAQSILCKICRVNRQLRKQSENKTRQAIPILSLLVEEIDHSLRCWSLKKKKVTTVSPKIYIQIAYPASYSTDTLSLFICATERKFKAITKVEALQSEAYSCHHTDIL